MERGGLQGVAIQMCMILCNYLEKFQSFLRLLGKVGIRANYIYIPHQSRRVLVRKRPTDDRQVQVYHESR